jgi:Flp pilus assembly protein TadD
MDKGMEKEKRSPAEGVVHTVAYNCFRPGRKSEALRLFEFNTLAFPSSSTVWHSFVAAQFDAGNKELAIRMYRKSLELKPRNKNALDRLRDLEKNKEE